MAKKDYLATYSKRPVRKYQAGGGMPAGDPAMGGAPAGGDPMEQMVMLAEAAMQGDTNAAAELGMAVAPMILEQAQAAMGGGMPQGGAPEPAADMPPAEGQPMMRVGGKAPIFKRTL
jgi:hypothetical protein